MVHHQGFDRLSRRRFLELSGAGVLASLLPEVHSSVAQEAASTSRVQLQVFDPSVTDTAAAVRETMLAATDLSWLKTGDSVFVKVASNSNYSPPSVTSPAVLEGVVSLLQEAGAGTVYVGDMSGAYFVRHLASGTVGQTGSTRESMRQNGLLAAAENAGATVHCFEEVDFEKAYIPGRPTGNHNWGDDLQVAEILDRVDHVVNLPRLGKHCLAGATLGLKNAIGWVSDHSRMVLHRDAATFQQKIAEVNAIPEIAEKTRLTLTLVDRALSTYGPDAGYHLVLNHPLVLASDDVVSHDQVALLTLLWARQLTPQASLLEDPYPAQTNDFNWYFVRTTWGEEAIAQYQPLEAFDDLKDSTAMTHINYAFDYLHGGRPDVIEVVPGELALDERLVTLLTADPELHVALGSPARG